MPNSNPISALFQRYLENPMDPRAAVEMAKQPDITARYFEEFIASGRAAELTVKSRVHLFALIGISCRHREEDLLKKWLGVETDANMKHLLQKKLQLLDKDR